MSVNVSARAHAIFTKALGLERSQREAMVNEACRGDPALKTRVLRLLRAAEQSEGFLESPVLASAPDLMSRVPDAIGTYVVIGVLGAGGMATVYEAVQENPHRRVALKVMHQTMTHTDALLRFRLEAQMLARLHHPGIAQIYEAGTAQLERSSPSPFFAMELIPEALSITQYAERHRLSLRQRLEMFASVCDAVLHGHQNGIIHRDLKPANVLVAPDGRAKVIDFGIARSTESGSATLTGASDTRRLIGTLNAMSPEQCMDPGGIDARSDVYSLGVILYELVTGRLPHELSRCSIPQAVRVITEEQPQRAGVFCAEAAGDLEAIIATAIEKDRTRRYSGAGALAADIRRYLSDRPVEARRSTALEQVRKFARRNPPLATAIAAAVTLLVGGIVVSGSLAYVAIKARNAALQRERDLESVTAFQEAMLDGVDARAMGDKLRASIAEALEQSMGGDAGRDASAQSFDWDRVAARLNFTTLAVRSLNESILQRYIASINEQFAAQPLLRARLLLRVAATMNTFGLYTEAEPIMRLVLQIRRDELGPDHADTLRSAGMLGTLLMTVNKLDESLALLRDTHERCVRTLGDEHQMTLRAMSEIAGTHRRRGDLQEAERYWEQSLAALRRVLGDDHSQTLRTLNNVGLIYVDQGKFAEAERAWRELVDRRRRIHGEDHQEYRASLGNLGSLLLDLGKLDEARPLMESALESDRRRLGDNHPYTLVAMGQLSALLYESGDVAGAEALQRQCVAGRRATLGPEHPDTLYATMFLALLRHELGHSSEAEQMLRENLASQRRVQGERHRETLESMVALREILRAVDRIDEAIQLGAEIIALSETTSPQRPFELGRHKSVHGEVLMRAGQHAEAAAFLREGYDLLSASLGPAHPNTLRAAERVAEWYEVAHAQEPGVGHDVQEALWREKAQERATPPAPSPR